MAVVNKYRWMQLRLKLSPIVFLAPALVFFSIFVIWPIIQSIWLSFYRWNGVGALDTAEWVGLKNFIDLFTNDIRFFVSIKNNLLWLLLMLISPVAGMFLALFLNQRIAGMRAIKSLFFFPFVINLVVVGLVFSWFYNPDFGILSRLFQMVGLKPIPILADENIATFGIIVAALWPQTAYCMILYITGLSSVDNQVIEAGRIDGAKGLMMLWHIILPMLRPATFIATVVTIIGALRSFDLIAIMTDGGPYGRTYVLAFQMYEMTITNYRYGYGATIAVVLFLIMSIYIAYFLSRIMRNEKG